MTSLVRGAYLPSVITHMLGHQSLTQQLVRWKQTNKHGLAGGAVIGQVPSAPSPPRSTRIGPCTGSVQSVNLRASRQRDANTPTLPFSMNDGIPSLKGPNHTKTNTKLHGGRCADGQSCLLGDYYFMVKLLGTSLM